ncbi:MAG: hypothetical protein M1150_00630 [Patescibacteria group bacterium]|nr:hypothetical protein [Patescibacteria group bacterium]
MSELTVYICRDCGSKVGEKIKDIPAEEATTAVENTLKESGLEKGSPEYEKYYQRLLKERTANATGQAQIPDACPSCGKPANYEEVSI